MLLDILLFFKSVVYNFQDVRPAKKSSEIIDKYKQMSFRIASSKIYTIYANTYAQNVSCILYE